MKTFKMIPVLLSFGMFGLSSLGLFACSSSDNGLDAKQEEKEQEKPQEPEHVIVPVDYSAGRAMNAKLGKGINIGNAWESQRYASCKDDACHFPEEPYNFGMSDWLDAGWGNPIEDSDFEFLKSVGFNSVRIPVRWQHNSNPITHEVNPERLAGVIEDVTLAVNAELAVVISFHWYYEIMQAANNAETDPVGYQAELNHFVSIWSQVATAMNAFPDNMVVFDILNEPEMKSAEQLNEVMTAGYKAIRAAAPGKTIMFESYHAAKFADINKLNLPQDGNIIYSGHYYEPYTFTHEGLGYKCVGDESFKNTAASDFKRYIASIKSLYPDVNGVDNVPVNLGEFGVAGNSSSCKENAPSDRNRIIWISSVIQAANSYNMSWHFWDYTKASGFEIYDRKTGTWATGFPGTLFN